MEVLVRLAGVTKSFDGLKALSNVNLEVARGETVVVLGPSGSGKSTLIRCINGLEPVDSGEVIFDELIVKGKRINHVRSEIGMVFQQFNLFPHLTAAENISLGPARVRGIPAADARRRALDLLEKVGIPEKANQYPAQLSGGQQQRVAIARALAMDPKLMMFDEPTSALDPEMIREVLSVMEALSKEGMTMIVVTHEMGFARHAADRVAFMDSGEIVEICASREFFESPRNARTKDFLSKILTH